MIHSPVLSVWCSGLPLEYIVASLPSSRNRNQPLEPVLSSSAAASLHTYRASRPRHNDHSPHEYATLLDRLVASSVPPGRILELNQRIPATLAYDNGRTASSKEPHLFCRSAKTRIKNGFLARGRAHYNSFFCKQR